MKAGPSTPHSSDPQESRAEESPASDFAQDGNTKGYDAARLELRRLEDRAHGIIDGNDFYDSRNWQA